MKTYLCQTALIFASILVFSLTSCEREDFYNTREEDQEELGVLKREIDKLAGQFSCENASEWKFTPIGTKACGGAGAYIAYSSKIDESAFLKKVALYTQKQNALNVKWGYISDCAMVIAPKSVECVDGKPKFVY